MIETSESKALVTADSGALGAPADASRVVPAIVAAGGDKAMRRYLEFFAVTIDNPNTRAAYFHACRRFFAWCDARDPHHHRATSGRPATHVIGRRDSSDNHCPMTKRQNARL
jgi:hypothetical protein